MTDYEDMLEKADTVLKDWEDIKRRYGLTQEIIDQGYAILKEEKEKADG